MAEGTIINSVHKAFICGMTAEVTASTAEDFATGFHSACSQIRNLMNTGEMTFLYLVLNYNNLGAPYYGYIVKNSSRVMTGIVFYPGVTDKRMVKLRDDSNDSAATFNIITIS